MRGFIVFVTVLAPIVSLAASIDEEMPTPWQKNGVSPAKELCRTGIDTEIEELGSPNLTVKCPDGVEGFAGVMQSFAADNYRGERVRFSALVKNEGIEAGWGGLWMRVDDHDRRGSAFDNMQNRPIQGTSDWSKYSVVLDVSDDASGIYFGALLNGKGQLWISALKFETVDKDTPTTGPEKRLEPENLELER